MHQAKRVIKTVRTDAEWRALGRQAGRLSRISDELERDFLYEVEGISFIRKAAIQAEIEALRRLQKTASTKSFEHGLEELRQLSATIGTELIRMRIALEIPQKVLAERMGVPAKRISIWERENYSKLRLEGATKLLQAMIAISREEFERNHSGYVEQVQQSRLPEVNGADRFLQDESIRALDF